MCRGALCVEGKEEGGSPPGTRRSHLHLLLAAAAAALLAEIIIDPKRPLSSFKLLCLCGLGGWPERDRKSMITDGPPPTSLATADEDFAYFKLPASYHLAIREGLSRDERERERERERDTRQRRDTWAALHSGEPRCELGLSTEQPYSPKPQLPQHQRKHCS